LSGSEGLKDKIVNVLKSVYDPEIPVNVWDLGLIYDIKVSDEGDVNIKMTLTAPGCPLAWMIVDFVKAAVKSIKEVKDVNVELVWDPPWTPLRMTPEGREQFKKAYGYDIVEQYLKYEGR